MVEDSTGNSLAVGTVFDSILRHQGEQSDSSEDSAHHLIPALHEGVLSCGPHMTGAPDVPITPWMRMGLRVSAWVAQTASPLPQSPPVMPARACDVWALTLDRLG